MLSKFIEIGDKIELQSVERKSADKNGEGQKVYHSSVHGILTEDTLEIAMPIEQNKLVLLAIDSQYDLVFYGSTGLYQCFARVVDRYKSNNLYILLLELTSNLRKYQRREFYRFSCALDMCARNLEDEEVQELEEKQVYELREDIPLKRSVIVDISGGGLRFLSNQRYEENSYIYCIYNLVNENGRKKYEVICKVISVRKLDNRPGVYEHRVQYFNLSREAREAIIKFIFEEERKSRKKERFL